MKAIPVGDNEVLFTATREELAALCNALNYVTNGVELGGEYAAVIGVEPRKGRKILEALIAALDAA